MRLERRRGIIDPRRRAAGRQIEPLGVEADRAPDAPTRLAPPGQPRRQPFGRVDFGEQGVLGVDQRRRLA